MASSEKARLVSQCLELAILLEASANKPGNVNRTASFENTGYEHFLASAVAASPFFEQAATQGSKFSEGEIRISDVRLGQIIKNCVANINYWQRGGNTLLGTVILLSPVAVAAGMSPVAKGDIFEIQKLRQNVKLVVESTTPEDAVDVYEAIKIANPSGLGTVPELDISDPNSVNKILGEKISLYDTFMIASERDTICSEWTKNYPITFEVAYPYLMEQISETLDLNHAIVHSFLKVLADYPDSFIARKVGIEKAQEVSYTAKEILKLGGLATSSGRKRLHDFNLKLRKSTNLLNPGTTADIIAAALALSILSGYRP